MDISHLVRPDSGGNKKPNKSDVLANFQEYTYSAMQRAHELAVEIPFVLHRNYELENQVTMIEQNKQAIAKLSEQNAILLEQNAQQKEEIELLKKTLESLGILPSMDNNLNKIVKQTERNAIPEKLGNMIGSLMNEFDQFKKDYDVLLEHHFFEIDKKNEKLVSQYGKPFIYDYFKFIKDKNQDWKAIEALFGERNLRTAWGSRKKLSEGMEKWSKLQEIDKSIIEGKVFPLPT
jgi:DNA repair exonuclease SbcCD ATPase subunit